MMNSNNTNQKGFTLIELMVAMAIASVLMAGIYTFYHNQLKTHITQQEMVDMQQDARAAMYMMTREIRMAGYDPQYISGATIRTANDEAIAFDSDENRNGAIETDERFYYALNNGSLERGGWNNPSSPVPDALNPVALNVDALNFVYLDNAGWACCNRSFSESIASMIRKAVSSSRLSEATSIARVPKVVTAPVWA